MATTITIEDEELEDGEVVSDEEKNLDYVENSALNEVFFFQPFTEEV